MLRAMLGRADLVRLAAAGDDDAMQAMAAALRLEHQPVESVVPSLREVFPESQSASMADGAADSDVEIPECTWPLKQAPMRFWRACRFEVRDTTSRTDKSRQRPRRSRKDPQQGVPYKYAPLNNWSVLGPRLRSALVRETQSERIDVLRLVQQIATGNLLDRIPRLSTSRWGDRIHVVLDRSDRLIPYFGDQENVLAQLRQILPRNSIQLLAGSHPSRLNLVRPSGRVETYRVPIEPTTILVLGDLGALATHGQTLQEAWLRFAGQLHGRDCRLVALAPCAVSRVPPNLRRVFSVRSWQRDKTSDAADPWQRASLVQRLLTLISPAIRVEPDLLRAIRYALPELSDASLEAEVWQHPLMTGRHVVAGTLDPAEAKKLLLEFERIDGDIRREVLWQIRHAHRNLPPEIWGEEVRRLAQSSRRLIPDADVANAEAQLESLLGRVRHEVVARYCQRAVARVSDAGWNDENFGPIYRNINSAVHPDRDRTLLPGYDPAETPTDGEIKTVTIVQPGGRRWQFGVPDDISSPAGLLGSLRSRNNVIVGHWLNDDVGAPDSGHESFWRSGRAPAWAADWGTDQYGPWATFTVTGHDGDTVTQRLRWIPPGEFLMGSADDEPERSENEGPRHKVQLAQGLWLADTACTQALWQSTTGENPSHFQGLDLPVENVSWNDVQTFLQQLASRIFARTTDEKPPFQLRLPTEAEWEYACRAGTATPFSFGRNISTDQVNYDGNYPYANGPKGAYRQRPVPVGSLPPNAWGLFELHGNVWEWCQDGWQRRYSQEAVTDPVGPQQASGRVLRGGSWIDKARYARSACRSADHPGGRNRYIGFRCALVQAGAEPLAADESRETAEPRPSRRHGGGAPPVVVNLSGRQADEISFEPSSDDELQPETVPREDGAGRQEDIIPGTRIVFLSDQEQLEIERVDKPSWASAIGRDRHGLWADLTVESQGGIRQEPETTTKRRWWSLRVPKKEHRVSTERPLEVIQRLRWIPPGRFLMGSPESEDGHEEIEGPQHDVVLSTGFWLFDTPCTQALWLAVMGNQPSWFKGASRPVEQVSWDDCQQFIQQLGDAMQMEGLTLPTEAEWEYACRAGTSTPFSCGASLDDTQACINRSMEEGTMDVGSFAANTWGLFDMHGNLWEWCQDRWYREYVAELVIDPTGPTKASRRVLRGGSWGGHARLARSACRGAYHPEVRIHGIGFRCALVQASRAGTSGTSAGRGKSTEETPDRVS